MSYSKWFKSHGEKHKKIMDKLKDYSDDEIIEYFRFENMVKSEPDFCPLYLENKKCHDIEVLNCYLCACPNFRFNDEGFKKINRKTLFSICSIDSKDGAIFETDDAIHQSCSACLVPHSEEYIRNNFLRDWFFYMKNVNK